MTYMTVKQVAELLKVSESTIRNWIREGILRKHQIGPGRKVLITTTDIENALLNRVWKVVKSEEK